MNIYSIIFAVSLRKKKQRNKTDFESLLNFYFLAIHLKSIKSYLFHKTRRLGEHFYHVLPSPWLSMMDGCSLVGSYLPKQISFIPPSPLFPDYISEDRVGKKKRLVIHSPGPKGLMCIFQTWDGGTMLGINGTARHHSPSFFVVWGWRIYKWYTTPASFNKLRYFLSESWLF